jgi:ribonucleoside-diphosphate reductase subunit M2
VQVREAKAFYGFQLAIEGIHNEMYSVMIETLIQDEAKRASLFDAVNTFPALKKKASWALKYMDRDHACFGVRLTAFIIMEYIFFSASFAAIFYFKKKNKMHGLCFSNELISRDEGLHAKFGCLLFNKYLENKPSAALITEMVKSAVDIETEFVCESLPVALIGLSATSMTQYVQYIADHMLTSLNKPKIYKVDNPFGWMETISLQGKTNFFEKRVGEYSKAGVGTAAVEVQFSVSEDF